MLLEVKNLWVHYGSAEVLKDISCQVKEGATVAFLGSNGAGKTTAVRTISGLKAPTSGEILYQGKRIDGDLPQNIVKYGIIQVPESKALFPYMTVWENLKLGGFLRKDRKQLVRDLDGVAVRFPVLKERKNKLAITLSGGEQQILAIARSLMAKPNLLLLDEPSLGLSPMNVREIGRIVRDINQQGVSVVLVEQNARLALGVVQKGYVFETGAIVLQGNAKDLKDNDYIRKSYLGQ